mmetsp:Transcript_2909/g.7940  ORF Transcript_2909/g.7940 Transcript_2909/m.7940 type:complete len:141 (-) Transcript_2909:791-1213(-)
MVTLCWIVLEAYQQQYLDLTMNRCFQLVRMNEYFWFRNKMLPFARQSFASWIGNNTTLETHFSSREDKMYYKCFILLSCNINLYLEQGMMLQPPKTMFCVKGSQPWRAKFSSEFPSEFSSQHNPFRFRQNPCCILWSMNA